MRIKKYFGVFVMAGSFMIPSLTHAETQAEYIAKRVDMEAFSKEIKGCIKGGDCREDVTGEMCRKRHDCVNKVLCGKHGQAIRRAAKEFDPISNADVEIECKKP